MSDSMVCQACGNAHSICLVQDLCESNESQLVLMLTDPDVCVWGTCVPAERWEEEDAIGLDMDDRFLRFDASKDKLAQHDADIRMVLAGRKLGVEVSLYRHSADIWYRAGSRSMPDEQWDVAHRAGVLIPGKDTIQWWRKTSKHKGGKAVRDQMLAWADSVLEAYTSWCNGWIYEIRLDATPGDRCLCSGSLADECQGAYVRGLRDDDVIWLAESADRLGKEAQKALKQEHIERKMCGTPALPGME